MSKLSSEVLLTGLTVVLLALFTLPAWTGLLALILEGMNGEKSLSRWFFVFLTQPSPIWDLVRTALATLIAAVAGASFGRWTKVRAGVIAGAVLLMFVPLLVLGLAFMDMNISGALWQNVDQTVLAKTAENGEGFQTIWNGYLAGQTQTLAAHLALFLGLKLEKTS